MAGSFNVVISPVLKTGKTEKEVAKKLAQMLKVDQKIALSWLTSKSPTVIVKGTSKEMADKYARAITNCGAGSKVVAATDKDGVPKKAVGKTAKAKKSGSEPTGRIAGILFKRPLIGITVIAGLTLAIAYAGQYWWLDMERQRLVSTPLAPKIKDVASVTSASLGLYQTGNRNLVVELAEIIGRMRGVTANEQRTLLEAVADMMKGLGSSSVTDHILEKVKADDQSMNQSTLGGIKIKFGVTHFTESDLEKISSPFINHGFENLLDRVAQRGKLENLQNPEKPVSIDTLGKMEDEEITELLKGLSMDQEWDQYLSRLLNKFLQTEQMDEARVLVSDIKNPVVKSEAIGRVILFLHARRRVKSIVEFKANIMDELQKISDPDSQVGALMTLSNQLALVGEDTEPESTLSEIRKLASEATNVYVRPLLWGKLSEAQFKSGDSRGAAVSLDMALKSTSAIPEKIERLAVFCKLSKRYYDVRSLTIAQEILDEAAAIASTELDGSQRARIFAEIAMASGYMGDLEGALLSAANASDGKGKQQLLSRLGQLYVDVDKPHSAAAIVELMDDRVESSKVLIRLVSMFIHKDQLEDASHYLKVADSEAKKISELELRIMITGQLARLYRRLNLDAEAKRLFSNALTLANKMNGRKADMVFASLALDQAKGLELDGARNSVARIKEPVIRAPIEMEVDRIEKILASHLPAGI